MQRYRDVAMILIRSSPTIPLFVVLFTGGPLLLEFTFGRPLESVGFYWLRGLISGTGFWFIQLSIRQGWLRGVFLEPKRVQELREKRQALQQDRLNALESARKTN
jgi:hypothetical protein